MLCYVYVTIASPVQYDRKREQSVHRLRPTGLDTLPDLVLVRAPSFGLDWVFDPFQGCVAVTLVFSSIGDDGLISN